MPAVRFVEVFRCHPCSRFIIQVQKRREIPETEYTTEEPNEQVDANETRFVSSTFCHLDGNVYQA